LRIGQLAIDAAAMAAPDTILLTSAIQTLLSQQLSAPAVRAGPASLAQHIANTVAARITPSLAPQGGPHGNV
jgi:hypothetical protein